MVARPGEEHRVVGRLPGVPRPGHVHGAGVRAGALVHHDVALVLERTRAVELRRRRTLGHLHGAQIGCAVAAVGRHVDAAVHRLRPVETDEPVEQSTAGVERLRRIARRTAHAMRGMVSWLLTAVRKWLASTRAGAASVVSRVQYGRGAIPWLAADSRRENRIPESSALRQAPRSTTVPSQCGPRPR